MTGSSRSLGGLKLPGYLLHKSSGHARVIINGDEIYLGPYGSEESRKKYGELIAKYIAGVPIDPLAAADDAGGISIAELLLGYLSHAEAYYRKRGKVTDEYGCIKSALKPLAELYGMTLANDFGPLALKAVRQKMIDSKTKCRRYINMSIGRIRRAFRWGVENELVAAEVLQKLEAVTPLLAGRTTAIDHEPRHPVPDADLAAVKAKVNQRTRDMMDLAEICGARPGELVSLTWGMIDRSRDVWVATLDDHKTVHRGKRRVLLFGQRCQTILTRYLKADPGKRIFPIARATFSAVIKKACLELKLPKFTGHWLRHNAASRTRKDHGLDAAQILLGHSGADVTQVYAQLDLEKGMQLARDAG